MPFSSVTGVAIPPLSILTAAPTQTSSQAQRQSTASTAVVVREPGGKYVALVNGATVSGASVQSVENNVVNLVNIFA
jgi:hypothetical protein